MHALRTLPTLKHIKYAGKPLRPVGDPREMEYGSRERSRWFEQARAYVGPNWDPAKANPNRLQIGSIKWHLWCEWDAADEAMDLFYMACNADAIADYMCQEPEAKHDCIDLSSRIPRSPKRTRRRGDGRPGVSASSRSDSHRKAKAA